MKIEKKIQDETVTLAIQGRLDTTTAPELEDEINGLGDSFQELVLDCGELSYISSAGLRVLLSAQKAANASGSRMTLTHVNEEIMEVFDMTGFSNFLTIA
ncbi:MAG TPA: anti-sigma factor antagonist [Ruminococcus sp.]|nr:anti-sigma factor antagonist [Ruminococcus sp.]